MPSANLEAAAQKTYKSIVGYRAEIIHFLSDPIKVSNVALRLFCCSCADSRFGAG